MIHRQVAATLLQMASQYPVVAVTGPRQSGKTTLVRALFGKLPYVSLEEPDRRAFALEDPRGFLAAYEESVDESRDTDDADAELAQLLATAAPESPAPRLSTDVVVNRHSDTDVLEAHAEAHLESLKSLITRLPPETSNEYETYILSVIAQCVKAEMLAANSWRVAVNAGAESADRLMTHLKALETIRTGLLERMPAAIATRFDQACARSGLPESVIAALLGVTAEQLWDIRNRGAIPPGALPRVRAFVAGQS